MGMMVKEYVGYRCGYPSNPPKGFDRLRSYHTEYDVRDEKETIKPICERREDDENCYLLVHMPELNKGGVKSKIVGPRYYRLTIEGHKMQEDFECIKYKDSFNIPEYINGSGTIVGKMEDGELAITLPKMKEGEERTLLSCAFCSCMHLFPISDLLGVNTLSKNKVQKTPNTY
nr:hypothetical protein [Tanacetum cinerariifolium]